MRNGTVRITLLAVAEASYVFGHALIAIVLLLRLLTVFPVLPPLPSSASATYTSSPARIAARLNLVRPIFLILLLLFPPASLIQFHNGTFPALAWFLAALLALRGTSLSSSAAGVSDISPFDIIYVPALASLLVTAVAAAITYAVVAVGGGPLPPPSSYAFVFVLTLTVLACTAVHHAVRRRTRQGYTEILPVSAPADAALDSSAQLRETSYPPGTAAQTPLDHHQYSLQCRALPPNLHNSSALGLLYFHWINPLVKAGRNQTLEIEDMPELVERLRSQCSGPSHFYPIWLLETRRRRSFMLWRALGKAFAPQLLLGGILKILNDCCVFLSPWILRRIIQHLQWARANPHTPFVVRDGLLLAFGLMCVNALQSLFFNHYFANNVEVQVQVAGALVSSIYMKSCKLSSDARARFTSGFISNLMATDARTLADLTLYLNTLWSGIEQILIALAMLIGLLGLWPTVAGVMVVACSVPVQGRLVGIIRRTRELASSWTDERVKIVSEALSGIRVVKLHAWESAFLKRILDARLNELNLVRHALLVQAFSSSLVGAIPTSLSLATFGTYVLLGGRLDAAVVFPAITLFNVLRPPMLILPSVIINIARAAAAASRVESFMLAEELTPLSDGPHAVDPAEFSESGCDVIASNAAFAWDPLVAKSVGPTLSQVSLRIPKGSLVCILGQTACGKSTLLQSLLGEVPILSGQAGLRPGIRSAFCHQVPFIQNATLRDNILFGRPMDMVRYRRVLEVCCLLPDLKILPAGDLTEIGGRGINLSGGQRSRVSLARATYSDSELVLFDAPLAAVDAHVAKTIFEECIVGELRDRTRLLATNHLNFASSTSVDFIAIVKEGTLVEFGRREELMADSSSVLSAFLHEVQSTPQANNEITNSDSGVQDQVLDAPRSSQIAQANDGESDWPKSPDNAGNGESAFEAIRTTDVKKNHGSEGEERMRGRLIQREAKSVGRVALRHYVEYFNAVGGPAWVLSILLFTSCNLLLNVGVNIWLSIWSGTSTRQSAADLAASVERNLTIYATLSFSAILAQSVAEFTLAFSSVRASVRMHEKLCSCIFGAPMIFFETTPLGRIINRFNASIDKIDNALAPTLQSVVRTFLALLVTFGLISYSTPWFIAVIIPATASFLYIQEYYRKTAVDLRRIESLTRSPLYSHFSETLDGVATLRAYGAVTRTVAENRAHTDLYLSVVFSSAAANRWLSLRLEILGSAMVFAAAAMAVISFRSVPPELSGLVLAYAMQTVSYLAWAVRQLTEAESQMSAVEQVSEYSSVPPFAQEERPLTQSADEGADQNDILSNQRGAFRLVSTGFMRHILRGQRREVQARWPRRGKVEFKEVTMRYRPSLEPALRAVSLTIQPGWHVGIVGRTGAGKSSLIGTLFRLQEVEAGRIEIDGRDISNMSLYELRSSLSVIAQEAVLFSGTIRSNLDMTGSFGEAAVQKAFEACGLSVTSAIELTLDTTVSENGSNFSVGQRQLICLGRALLLDSMVLVLDEATASLDDWTDRKLGETIRSEMGHCTIIIIAHRLHTVMQCDRVCVMHQGQVVEFGTPLELLSRPSGSLFADLVNETGPTTARYLRKLAETPRSEGGDSSHFQSRHSMRLDGHVSASRTCGLMDRTRGSVMHLRSAIAQVDGPEWTKELQRMNWDVDEWKMCLSEMVESLAELSSKHLAPVHRAGLHAGRGARDITSNDLNPDDDIMVDVSTSPRNFHYLESVEAGDVVKRGPRAHR